MCQLTPTIFPCCSRTYVIVKRLSTCPEDWPKQKCPPELCLQTGGAVPGREDRRAQGVCWRCQACWAGKSPQDTEAMRPAFDRAPQAEGLEETTPTERRLRAEKRGHCWFCGNKNPRLKRCNMCDIKPFLTPTVITKLRSAGNRASRMSGGDRIQKKRPSADHHGTSKRLKVEHFDEVNGGFGDEDMGIHGRALTPDPDGNPYGTDPTTYQTSLQRQQSRVAFGHHQDQVLGGDADGIDLHTGGHQRQITYSYSGGIHGHCHKLHDPSYTNADPADHHRQTLQNSAVGLGSGSPSQILGWSAVNSQRRALRPGHPDLGMDGTGQGMFPAQVQTQQWQQPMNSRISELSSYYSPPAENQMSFDNMLNDTGIGADVKWEMEDNKILDANYFDIQPDKAQQGYEQASQMGMVDPCLLSAPVGQGVHPRSPSTSTTNALASLAAGNANLQISANRNTSGTQQHQTQVTNESTVEFKPVRTPPGQYIDIRRSQASPTQSIAGIKADDSLAEQVNIVGLSTATHLGATSAAGRQSHHNEDYALVEYEGFSDFDIGLSNEAFNDLVDYSDLTLEKKQETTDQRADSAVKQSPQYPQTPRL